MIQDDVDDSNNDFIEQFAMVSGSHSSTLDRLHAWERKLYDEIKVHYESSLSKGPFSFDLTILCFFLLSAMFSSYIVLTNFPMHMEMYA